MLFKAYLVSLKEANTNISTRCFFNIPLLFWWKYADLLISAVIAYNKARIDQDELTIVIVIISGIDFPTLNNAQMPECTYGISGE